MGILPVSSHRSPSCDRDIAQHCLASTPLVEEEPIVSLTPGPPMVTWTPAPLLVTQEESLWH